MLEWLLDGKKIKNWVNINQAHKLTKEWMFKHEISWLDNKKVEP
jgi:hypothetical protein